MSELENKIQERAEDFFRKMGFAIAVKTLEEKDGMFFLNIQSNEAGVLIGENGDILFKIQSILNKIINKDLKQDICLDLDINDYKQRRSQYLQETAQKLATEVLETKQSKTIAGLFPYERRIIHMQISKYPDLETESVGDGEERKLIIKIKNAP